MTVLLVAAISLLYRLARDMGKRCEGRMTKRLGAKPSVIILRFSDHTIGGVSKRRYHQRINEVFGLALPLEPSAETPVRGKSIIIIWSMTLRLMLLQVRF